MRPAFDLSVYLVTDPSLGGARPVADIVRQAVAGGVTLVQLRDPVSKTRALVELGLALKDVLSTHGIPLIINDRVDVALAVGAAGVHVGQSDMRVSDIRRLVGPDMLVGVSAANAAELAAIDAGLEAIDYLGVGPVYSTATKADAGAAVGLDAIGVMRRASGLPVVAIGGIDAARAREAVRAGADGVAVVSAIMAAGDPAAAARAVAAEVEKGRSA